MPKKDPLNEPIYSSDPSIKAFVYRGVVHIRVFPAKYMFNSTMIYEVVNRGDIFAVNTENQQIVIIAGQTEVEFFDVGIHKKVPF